MNIESVSRTFLFLTLIYLGSIVILIATTAVAFSIMAPLKVETLKMFNIIVLKDNATDEAPPLKIRVIFPPLGWLLVVPLIQL